MWVGLAQSAEGFGRLKTAFPLADMAFGLEMRLLPVSPACWPILKVLDLQSIYNHVN